MTVCGLELSPCPRVCVICGWWEEFRHARQSRSTHQLEQYAQATDRASECQAINNCARSYEGERSFLYSVKPSQMRWCCIIAPFVSILPKFRAFRDEWSNIRVIEHSPLSVQFCKVLARTMHHRIYGVCKFWHAPCTMVGEPSSKEFDKAK